MWRFRDVIAICVALGVVLGGESVAGRSLDTLFGADLFPRTSVGKPRAGMFLVASRGLNDPRFSQSIVYLVTHGEDGTLGLIVNRPGDISLTEAAPDLGDNPTVTHALYYGGPVGLPMILMLTRSESATEGMMHVADDVYISSERSVMEAALANQPGDELRFYIGYSGWGGRSARFRA